MKYKGCLIVASARIEIQYDLGVQSLTFRCVRPQLDKVVSGSMELGRKYSIELNDGQQVPVRLMRIVQPLPKRFEAQVEIL